jgi:hypothetical protein
VPAHILYRKTCDHFSGICASPHGSYGLKVDSDVSSGIELRARTRRAVSKDPSAGIRCKALTRGGSMP